MYNDYREIALLKDLFVKKFDPKALYEAVKATQTGCLLRFFSIKQLDQLNPSHITDLMKDFKLEILQAYHKQTSNKVFQRILDFCSDKSMKYESKLKIGIKDLDWFVGIVNNNICDLPELWRDRFELNPVAKKTLLEKYSANTVKQFMLDIKEKDLVKYVDKNIDFVRLMKKPTAKMLWDYYNAKGSWNMCRYVLVDTYPTDLLVKLVHDTGGNMLYPILEKNDKTGLLTLYLNVIRDRYGNETEKLVSESKLSDSEFKTVAALSNYDRGLVIKAIEEKLGVENRKDLTE